MTKNFRTILTPLLVTSYVFGLRIANLSSHSKLLFSVLYLLLVWSLTYFISVYIMILSFNKYPIDSRICFWLEILTTLSSIVFSTYYAKKFENCLKKFDFVDNTLLQLGTMTDYNKLRKETKWLVFGWAMIIIPMNFILTLLVQDEYDHNFAIAILRSFIQNYWSHVNIIDYLTTAIILKYIGLKFDQVNEHLQNLMKNNKNRIKRAWENFHQCRFPNALNRKSTIWITIHLHLELHKISCEIDTIFGKQMTFNMACYFAWMAIELREILYTILVNNYVKSRITYATHHIFWLSSNFCKFLLINYMCETVSFKANVTANLLNKLTYFIGDVELRKIISQFLLQTVLTPIRFYGNGFFQFGYKFFYRFIMSIATILVIIIQAYVNK